MTYGYDARKMHAVCHDRYYIEILLALRSLRPCTMIACPKSQIIFVLLVGNILHPLMAKYMLGKWGFGMKNVYHRSVYGVARWGELVFAFVDCRSVKFPLLNTTLFTKPISETDFVRGPEAEDKYHSDVWKCLGCPVSRLTTPTDSKVIFVDPDEFNVFSGISKATGRSVSGVNLFCSFDNAEKSTELTHKACLDYFCKCQEIFKHILGVDLKLKLQYRVPLQRFWSRLHLEGTVKKEDFWIKPPSTKPPAFPEDGRVESEFVDF